MADEKKVAAPEPEVDTPGKDEIYERIGTLVKERTGKRIGKVGGREIFDMVVGEFFTLATQQGSMRFNGGFGSLHVRTYQEGERRLPSGQMTKFGTRKKLRYEEGVVVKALVENGGNLEDALKVRGVRAPKAATAGVVTAVAPAPVAVKAPAPVAGAPAAGDEATLDLA